MCTGFKHISIVSSQMDATLSIFCDSTDGLALPTRIASFFGKRPSVWNDEKLLNKRPRVSSIICCTAMEKVLYAHASTREKHREHEQGRFYRPFFVLRFDH